MRLPLLLAALLLSPASVPAQVIDWTRDPVSQLRLETRPKPDAPRSAPADTSFSTQAAPTPQQLACLPEVVAAFQKIWERAGYGGRKEEAAFRIDWIDGKIEIVMAPWTWGDHRTTVPITRDTIAIAHTHPRDSIRLPSDPGDYSFLPNFVVTAYHVWLADPVTRKPVLITNDRPRRCASYP